MKTETEGIEPGSYREKLKPTGTGFGAFGSDGLIGCNRHPLLRQQDQHDPRVIRNRARDNGAA